MSGRSSSPFNPRTIFLLLIGGLIAFFALIYFIGSGNTGRNANDGRAHVASNGLNGYSALARLAEAEGLKITRSRSPSGLETDELLVLTPSAYVDPEDISDILEERQYRGPTLVILPKWFATGMPDNLPDEVKDKVKDGWVRLIHTNRSAWTDELPEPYSFTVDSEDVEEPSSWSGLDYSGVLPTTSIAFAKPRGIHDALVTDEAGHALAIDVIGAEDSEYYDSAYSTVFVVEPDLMNNYGLANGDRARIALELLRYSSYYEDGAGITFDLTLNGFGGSTNLLTLAFQPPFLAATICLVLALLIVGWRAFRRFGPAIAEGPAIAFGKSRLIANGAGLILRAKRIRLLAESYVALRQRRLGERLGLHHPDPEAIDAALERRLPGEKPFTYRAADLRNARRATDILRAASALKELEGKLQT